MKRNSFDESAPVKLVVSNGPNEPMPLPCRVCGTSTKPKFLIDQGGLCGHCFKTYCYEGNAGLNRIAPGYTRDQA
jgi:hypothetical protein